MINNLVTVVNDAYGRGEGDLWKDPQVKRTDPADLENLIKEDKIVIAYQTLSLPEQLRAELPEDLEEFEEETLLSFQEPCGSIFCDATYDQSNHVGKFGMLCATEEMTGKGLGSLLIAYAENRAKAHGCNQMRLELLTPRDYEHPVKKFLIEWYTRIGY